MLEMTKEDKQRIKDICMLFNGQYVIVDGVRYIVPLTKWQYELKDGVSY